MDNNHIIKKMLHYVKYEEPQDTFLFYSGSVSVQKGNLEFFFSDLPLYRQELDLFFH